MDAVAGPGAAVDDDVLNPWLRASFLTAADLVEEDTDRKKAECLFTIPACQEEGRVLVHHSSLSELGPGNGNAGLTCLSRLTREGVAHCVKAFSPT